MYHLFATALTREQKINAPRRRRRHTALLACAYPPIHLLPPSDPRNLDIYDLPYI
jgi:hypothetical protein